MSKFWLTLVLLLGVAVIGSNSLVLSPVLTDVAADLATTPVVVSRAISAYGGATAASALLLGFTVDRYGVRKVLVLGSVLLASGVFLSAAAHTWVVLAIAQAITGIAAGVMLPAIYTAATAVGGEDEGARMLGRVLMGWSVSLVAGVPVSAFIAERFGWQAGYLVLGALVLIALAGFLRLEPWRTGPEADAANAGLSTTWRAVCIPGSDGTAPHAVPLHDRVLWHLRLLRRPSARCPWDVHLHGRSGCARLRDRLRLARLGSCGLRRRRCAGDRIHLQQQGQTEGGNRESVN